MLLWPPQSLEALDVLLSDENTEAKVERLTRRAVTRSPISREQWRMFVEGFTPPPELASRVRPLWEDHRRQRREKGAQSKPTTRSRKHREWVMTTAAFACLAGSVVAIGVLVNSRIRSAKIAGCESGWRHLDLTGRRSGLVWRLVLLLWGLNLLDLLCTMLAQNSVGGFWEMNPLGRLMMGSSGTVGFFKVGAVAAGSALLLALRRYRGAEAAVWWLCLVYTVLTFRWTTYTSMFLS